MCTRISKRDCFWFVFQRVKSPPPKRKRKNESRNGDRPRILARNARTAGQLHPGSVIPSVNLPGNRLRHRQLQSTKLFAAKGTLGKRPAFTVRQRVQKKKAKGGLRSLSTTICWCFDTKDIIPARNILYLGSLLGAPPEISESKLHSSGAGGQLRECEGLCSV
ncbi:uncharacterized protein LOC131269085 [Anopheles coustani]|uniref:uncharacterized protein LOC131269085 n=1 Tax=Anopheles coustani TaxID=139045 RepID=UPI00265B08B0|nr:uncharacterized protein LOC131269085 [Anopheles coustani]